MLSRSQYEEGSTNIFRGKRVRLLLSFLSIFLAGFPIHKDPPLSME
jgi:hypothetical protein